MHELYSQFHLIQKAIHTTSHVLQETGGQTDSLQAAREQYLQALSHQMLIDTSYLKHIVE